MLDKIKKITSKKYFHMVMLIVIVTVILGTAGLLILRYTVEGEQSLPFELSKIVIISTGEGIDKQDETVRWAFDLTQNNDIYITIDKNDDFETTEAIKSVTLNNMQIEAKEGSNINIYKPDSENEQIIFNNSDVNRVQNIEFIGSMQSDLKKLEISNQGGTIALRIANEKIIEYKSDDETIVHSQLLKVAGVKNESLKFNVKFDLIITLQNGNSYISEISLELPTGNVVEEGTTNQEITDLSNIIFKKI